MSCSARAAVRRDAAVPVPHLSAMAAQRTSAITEMDADTASPTLRPPRSLPPLPSASPSRLAPADSDDNFEYRHVILPKPMLKLIPKRWVLFCSRPCSVSCILASVLTPCSLLALDPALTLNRCRSFRALRPLLPPPLLPRPPCAPCVRQQLLLRRRLRPPAHLGRARVAGNRDHAESRLGAL